LIYGDFAIKHGWSYVCFQQEQGYGFVPLDSPLSGLVLLLTLKNSQYWFSYHHWGTDLPPTSIPYVDAHDFESWPLETVRL